MRNIADRAADFKPMNQTTEPTTDPTLERNRARVQGFKRWVKRLRVIFAAAILLLGVYMVISYGMHTMHGEYRPGSTKVQSPIEDVMPGDTVLLLNLNLWREPKLGDIVIYDHPDPKDGAPSQLLGRVAGLPGETIHAEFPTFRVGERAPLGIGFVVGRDAPLKDGDVIPDGRYLILTDNDAVAYADSRDFGYIERAAIHKKVIYNMAFMLGQRAPQQTKQPD